jgi:two-component system sensor histidine kinase RegB
MVKITLPLSAIVLEAEDERDDEAEDEDDDEEVSATDGQR